MSFYTDSIVTVTLTFDMVGKHEPFQALLTLNQCMNYEEISCTNVSARAMMTFHRHMQVTVTLSFNLNRIKGNPVEGFLTLNLCIKYERVSSKNEIARAMTDFLIAIL